MASDKYTGLVRLFEGEEAKHISEDLGVSYGTVLRWKKELTTAQEENKVNALLAKEQGLLDNVIQQAQATLPVELQDTEEEAKIINGVKGLQRLEADLQQTASTINTRIRLMTGTCETIGEIVDLTDALCKIQTAFFGKGTQVNVQTNINNNSAGDAAYGEFLSDIPAQSPSNH